MDAFHPDAFPGLAKILLPLLSRDYGYYIEEKRISFVLWTKCARRLEIFGITIIFNNFFFFCVELSIFAVVHFSVETDAWT